MSSGVGALAQGVSGVTPGEVRARIQRDMERLNPRARWRYRAALRRLMREAEATDDVEAPLAPARRLTMSEILALALGVGAFGAGMAFIGDPATALAAAATACLAALVIGGPRADDDAVHDVDGVDLPPEADPAAMAFALHLAAMAESRRAYYVGEDPRAAAQRG